MIRHEEGFTLPEVLVGTVLGALLLLAMFGLMRTTFVALGTANDGFRGDNDIQTTLSWLHTDVEAGARTLAATSTTTLADDTLTLVAPDIANDRVLRVTYQYATTTVAGTAIGQITRTVKSGGTTLRQDTVATHLEPNYSTTPIFACSPSCATVKSITVTMPFRIQTNLIVRTVQVPLEVQP